MRKLAFLKFWIQKINKRGGGSNKLREGQIFSKKERRPPPLLFDSREYYVMSTKIYDKPNMMVDILSIRRFIDDGGGLHVGEDVQFYRWLDEVNREIGLLGLHIDESNYQKNSEYTNFIY